MAFLLFWVLGLLVGILTTIFNHALRDAASIANNLLFYQLIITVSLSGLFGFLGHVFNSDRVADSIGWQKGSWFQKELGFTELSWAILGVLCIWFKGYFWFATVIAVLPLFIAAGCIHIKETLKKKNYNPGNFLIIFPDFLIPLTLIVLSIIGKIWR